MARVLGRKARYFSALLERFGYLDGPTHSLVWPAAGVAVLSPAAYLAFGSFGASLVAATCAGHLAHGLADWAIYRRPVDLLWPLKRERLATVSRMLPPAVSGTVAGTAGTIVGGAAGPVMFAACGVLAYLYAAPLLRQVQPGVIDRILERIGVLADEPSGISLSAVAGGALAILLLVGGIRLMPLVAEKAAARAAAGGEYGNLSTHLIRPMSAETELDPERFSRLSGRLPVPEDGVFPEVVVGARVGAAVSGRGERHGELVDRLQNEYLMDATVVPVGLDGSLALDSSLARVEPDEEANPQPNGADDRKFRKVACRFALDGEVIRGTLGTGEFAKKSDPLSGALGGIRRALDVTGGERALVQLCVRQANEGSVGRVRSRIAEIDEKSARGGTWPEHQKGRPGSFVVAFGSLTIRKDARRLQPGELAQGDGRAPRAAIGRRARGAQSSRRAHPSASIRRRAADARLPQRRQRRERFSLGRRRLRLLFRQARRRLLAQGRGGPRRVGVGRQNSPPAPRSGSGARRGAGPSNGRGAGRDVPSSGQGCERRGPGGIGAGHPGCRTSVSPRAVYW